jgi:hypothetical protein
MCVPHLGAALAHFTLPILRPLVGQNEAVQAPAMVCEAELQDCSLAGDASQTQ